ncbi:MAG: flagellar biosynthesis protein FlhB, partial [Phycisphaerales bacterium]|nr:flagellar biosynthesis protein FlhB [Phycisphaerales bacterium]
MADTSQEKTEQPTQRRQSEARSQGQIGKSQDLSAAVVLLGGLLLLYYTGQKILARLVEITRGCLQADRSMTDVSAMGVTIMGVFREAALIVLPLMLL